MSFTEEDAARLFIESSLNQVLLNFIPTLKDEIKDLPESHIIIKELEKKEESLRKGAEANKSLMMDKLAGLLGNLLND